MVVSRVLFNGLLIAVWGPTTYDVLQCHKRGFIQAFMVLFSGL